VISDRDIRALLAERGIPCGEDADGAVALDSLSLAWLVHMLDVTFGVSLILEDADLSEFTSAAAIAAFADAAARAAAPAGDV
jgi:acyl carrier protein